MITVAIVSPFRFLETIQKVITDHDFDCAFRSYTYDSLTDIDEIYADCKSSSDIILFPVSWAITICTGTTRTAPFPASLRSMASRTC